MSKVAIKPYIDKSDNGNMGLTKQGLSIADGCLHKQDLRCLDSNGVKTYFTGLNEGAPEIQTLPAEQRDAKILDIRKTVVYLENQLAGNYSITESDIYINKKVVRTIAKKGPGGRPTGEEEEVIVDVQEFNPDFWKKVTKFKSIWVDEFDNSKERNRIPTFWDTVELKCSNYPTELDLTKPYNIMLVRAIEAGGFGDIIAPSLDAAGKAVRKPKFYLDKLEETAAMDTAVSKTRNKAGARLEYIYEKEQEKLFYIVKNLGTFSLAYRKNTPVDLLYKDANTHLDGAGIEKNKKIAIDTFLELDKLPSTELKLRAILKDANAMNIIGPKGDGHIYYHKKSIPMGKTIEDVIIWMKNDMNNTEMNEIVSTIEKEWNAK